MADHATKTQLPSRQLKLWQWLALVGTVGLLLILTIFTIKYNWQQIKNHNQSNDLFGMIKNYFQEGFSKNPPPVAMPSLVNQP